MLENADRDIATSCFVRENAAPTRVPGQSLLIDKASVSVLERKAG